MNKSSPKSPINYPLKKTDIHRLTDSDKKKRINPVTGEEIQFNDMRSNND